MLYQQVMAIHDPGEPIVISGELATSFSNKAPVGDLPLISRSDQELIDTAQNYRRQVLDRIATQKPELFHQLQNVLAFMDTVEGLEDEAFEYECGLRQFDPIVMDYLQSSSAGEPEALRYREMAKNIYLNQKIFEDQARTFVESNIERIYHSFGWTPTDRVEIGINFTTDETHNQGKKPLVVTFREGAIEHKLVLKPRSGLVDSQVLELFNAINQLPLESRSEWAPRLPYYQIITPARSDGWHLEEGFTAVSLCQFVGQEILLPTERADSFAKEERPDLLQFIRTKFARRDPEFLAEKERELKFMAKLFEEAQISDQHRFNLRFNPDGGPPLIPVDTEVCHQRSDMFLGHNGTAGVELSDSELELVHRFRDGLIQNRIPFRCLPLGTDQFANLILNGKVDRITEKILVYLRRNNFGGDDPAIIEQIRRRVQQDVMNRDVPMFTRVGDQLFYGQSGDLLIGSQIM